MTVATWNVNGVRARINNLVTWLKENNPDIVCLQETKTQDINFPLEPIQSLGYQIEIHGQKAFNGVAIISKYQPEEVIKGFPDDSIDEQARFIEAVFSINSQILRIGSLYIPNGNPLSSPKYDYKLSWLERFSQFASKRLELEEPLILAGDYNIIPEPRDCYNPKAWEQDAVFTPEVRQTFQKLQNIGFVDAIRATSDAPHLYSFWDYKMGAWEKNKGVRIDHLMLSPEAAFFLRSAQIDKMSRGIEKPSDHVPVMVSLEIP
ncbi:exodeoxyribonuclease III [Candidatus Liberibacter sp.]|uniref:exodeoxyribonuclease III n=1 Tax=Candidatus Liberibacter sp. TaxID=34022 RepID=UPI0015F37025|nr:exodeoxyribonuclease III [Candidatus Liberibacter sp.]MBA5724381.1 exodeoxyribonuclease III [Candidatus Liberibacter sp.]